MEELTTYKTFKQNLDNELNRAAEGFVRIGYLLKLARDNPHILAGSGYSSINEMAYKEYGIDKTIVSRWININDEFSEGGYSDKLKSEYQGYGYSKLAVMLNIPETIREELSPAFTKSEIQTIKDEIDEESHIAPMEVYLEGQAAEQEKIEDNFEKVLHQLMYEQPDKYVMAFSSKNEKDLQDIFAPATEAIYTVRVQGVGRFLLSMKPEKVSLVNIRNTDDKEMYEWTEFAERIKRLFDYALQPRESWEKTYNMPFPEKEEPKKEQEQTKKQEVAPVQHKEAPVKQVKKLEKKVVPAKKKKIETPKEDNEDDNTIRGYKAAITSSLKKMSSVWESDKTDTDKVKILLEETDKLIFRLKGIAGGERNG